MSTAGYPFPPTSAWLPGREEGSRPPANGLKARVRRHWNSTPCGTRGLRTIHRKGYFRRLEQHRYRVEPFIPDFAGFARSAGQRVLEVGVGAGTDFVQWIRHGADATGVDLTEHAVALTRERLALEGLEAEVRVADAEALPFGSGEFDLVYSYGVLHHTPDTARAIAEVHRVLRPGGTARIMLYHYPSITAMLLWAVHCAAQGRPWKSPRQAVFEFLESPGTKAYRRRELPALFADFELRSVETQLLPGDLIDFQPGDGLARRIAGCLFPRGLVRRFGKRLGHAMLIEAVKPRDAAPARHAA